jgi:hypothetical protein
MKEKLYDEMKKVLESEVTAEKKFYHASEIPHCHLEQAHIPNIGYAPLCIYLSA